MGEKAHIGYITKSLTYNHISISFSRLTLTMSGRSWPKPLLLQHSPLRSLRIHSLNLPSLRDSNLIQDATHLLLCSSSVHIKIPLTIFSHSCALQEPMMTGSNCSDCFHPNCLKPSHFPGQVLLPFSKHFVNWHLQASIQSIQLSFTGMRERRVASLGAKLL
jgi:hypothetical protein